MNGYRRLSQVDRIRIKDFLILGLINLEILLFMKYFQVKQGSQKWGPIQKLEFSNSISISYR